MPYIRLLLSEASAEAMRLFVNSFHQRGLLSQLAPEARLGCRPFNITVVRGLKLEHQEIIQRAITEISQRVCPFALSLRDAVMSDAEGCIEFHDPSAEAWVLAAKEAARVIPSCQENGLPLYIRIGSMHPTSSWESLREELTHSLSTLPPLYFDAVELESGCEYVNAPLMHTPLVGPQHVFQCKVPSAISVGGAIGTDCLLRFFSLGDFGHVGGQISDKLSACMDSYARKTGKPNLILGLGDNFYSGRERYYGVKSTTDMKWVKYWMQPYLQHSTLRVPWKVVLGNHDYDGNPDAQVEFSSAEGNPALSPPQTCSFQTYSTTSGETQEVQLDRVWQMPAKNYSFTEAGGLVEFFALDTNNMHDDGIRVNIRNLRSALERSRATWKIVFSHFPIYTAGRHHAEQGEFLKEELRLEDVLVSGKADAYITGHEHAMQHNERSGVDHFVAGSSCEYHFYKGRDPSIRLDWVDESGALGFLAAEVYADRLILKFVSIDGSYFKVLKTITKMSSLSS